MLSLELLPDEEFVKRLTSRGTEVAKGVLAYYDHRLKAFTCNPRLMLIPLDDHLVHRGDGIFETMLCVNKKIYQLHEHLDRLLHSASAIKLQLPCSLEELQFILFELLRHSKAENAYLRIFLGRGAGGFGISPKEVHCSSLYAVASSYAPYPAKYYEEGLRAFRSSIPAKQAYLAQIKSTNYLANVLMVAEGAERALDVPLCFDEKGFLAESAIANIALVKNKTLLLPKSESILQGTTLQRALELLPSDFSYAEKTIIDQDIFQADELLLFGTSPRCVSIISYENTPIADAKPGVLARLLRERLLADEQKNAVPSPYFS